MRLEELQLSGDDVLEAIAKEIHRILEAREEKRKAEEAKTPWILKWRDQYSKEWEKYGSPLWLSHYQIWMTESFGVDWEERWMSIAAECVRSGLLSRPPFLVYKGTGICITSKEDACHPDSHDALSVIAAKFKCIDLIDKMIEYLTTTPDSGNVNPGNVG